MSISPALIASGNDAQFALRGPSGRLYAGDALGCLTLSNPLRARAIALVEWPWFDRAVLMAIVANCVMLAALGPPGGDAPAIFAPEAVEVIELSFTLLFTAEMAIKIVAMGFVVHQLAYLRDHWNKLDFLVVSMCWLPLLFPQLGSYTSVRSIRALRPLRTVQRMPGMRKQVTTLLVALPRLGDVALLSSLVMVIFGVLGVQLFKGSLHYRCYAVGAAEPLDEDAGVCLEAAAPQPNNNGSATAQGSCSSEEECRWFGVNPVYGTVSFDSIWWAWMTLFQCLTLEGWVDVMYMEMAVLGPAVALYFVLFVMLGSFYLISALLPATPHGAA